MFVDLRPTYPRYKVQEMKRIKMEFLKALDLLLLGIPDLISRSPGIAKHTPVLVFLAIQKSQTS